MKWSVWSLSVLALVTHIAPADFAHAATVYGVSDTYSANYITVDLGNNDYSIYYSGHYTSSSGGPAPLDTFTSTYTVIGGAISSSGIAQGASGTVTYTYSATDTNVPPPFNLSYDFRSFGTYTGGTGAYDAAAGSFTTYSRQFSGAFNGSDATPLIPPGALVVDFGTELGLEFGSVEAPTIALPAIIDLNKFYADPAVTVAADGTSATIVEDPAISPVLLSNDPAFGDPLVIIGELGKVLRFNYDFEMAVEDDNIFSAFVLDPTTGGVASSDLFFSTNTAGDATVTFDLSGFSGRVLGLQFELGTGENDGASSAVVTISEVETAAVPLPPPLAMLASVLVTLSVIVVTRISIEQPMHMQS